MTSIPYIKSLIMFYLIINIKGSSEQSEC